MGSSSVRRRTEFVGVWFLPAEKAALEDAAQTLGMSVGALVRSSLHATHAIYIEGPLENGLGTASPSRVTPDDSMCRDHGQLAGKLDGIGGPVLEPTATPVWPPDHRSFLKATLENE